MIIHGIHFIFYTSITLGIILNELITNSLKYACEENKGSIKRTSEQLKISERKLGLRLTKYKIKAAEYKNKKN